jgi:excisionase family DNA binding protein
METSTQIERMAYRVGEWAQAMGISRSKAYEEIAAGRVPVIRIGTSIRIPADGARQYVARLTSEAGQ